jgi:hypothetical protein
MNKELIEKLSAIREDLLAFQALAQVGDAKKLAELVKQKAPTVRRNYEELWTYMTVEQKSRSSLIRMMDGLYDDATGRDYLTSNATREVPRMLADLDDIAENLNKGASRPGNSQ